jgi:putative alpha-1,2-mannosidase
MTYSPLICLANRTQIPVQDFDYKGFGTLTRSVSRTLEYSYNDFVISLMARGLGKDGDAEKYAQRSTNWQNLFKPDTKSLINTTNTGFVGFFQPRYLNRTWGYQDPLKCSHIDANPNSVCSLQNSAAETFESSLWEYGFFVPHDQGSLIGSYGGPELFIKRLDYLHNKMITDIGNEPGFLPVFQYHYAGRPGLSSKRSHSYIPKAFSPTPEGLPGNDDSGAMGSFVTFNMIGLFPNPGQNVYLIIPPYFESVAITSPITNKTARIRVENFDPKFEAIYIQNATLNGDEYRKNWIGHEFFTEGQELVLVVGKNESTWGTQIDDLPPSLGPYVGFNGSATFGRNSGRKGISKPLRYYGIDEGLSKQYWGAVGVM